MKIIFIILFLINLYLTCDSPFFVSGFQGEECLKFSNNTEQCSKTFSGSITFTQNNKKLCVRVIDRGNQIGVLTIELKKILYIPQLTQRYWTYGYDYLDLINNLPPPKIITDDTIYATTFLHNLNCNDTTNTLYNSFLCRCNRNCTILNNEVDDRMCGLYDYAVPNIGITGCNLCRYGSLVFTERFRYQFFQFNLHPKHDSIFQVMDYRQKGSFIMKLEIEFEDMSGKSNINFFPKFIKTLDINHTSGNNENIFGFTFGSNIFDNRNNLFPNSVFLLPNNGIYCFFSNPNFVLAKDSFPPFDFKIGSIQALSLEDITNQDINNHFTQIIDNNQIIYKATTNLKASSSLLTKKRISYCEDNMFFGTLLDNNLRNFFKYSITESVIDRMERRNLSETFPLPNFVNDYFTTCSYGKDRIISEYEGVFTWQLNYKTNINYNYIIDKNVVCPKIIKNTIPQGFKNSTLGSFILITMTSTCLEGLARIDLSNNDEEDINILGASTFKIIPNIDLTYNISFRLNTKLTKICINFTLIGEPFNNVNSVSSCYEPIAPKPDDSNKNEQSENESGTTNNNCQDIFCCNLNLQCNGNILCCLFGSGNTFLPTIITVLVIIIIIVVGIIILSIVCALLPKK